MVWNRAHENEVGKATSGRLESKHYQESYLDALLGRKTHIIFSFFINFSEKVQKIERHFQVFGWQCFQQHLRCQHIALCRYV